MDNFKLFIPITKIDAAKRLVFGLATAEKRDASNEVCDYATTKPLYEKWSGDIAKVTDGKSLGNVRAMHGPVAAGKVTTIAFNDAHKQIEICAKVVDDKEWIKVEEGVYTGFSQGGKYVKRWKDPDDDTLTRYTAEPYEISLVDVPCLESATFSVIKADGSTELRKFKAADKAPTNEEIATKATELAKAAGDEAKWQDFLEPARAELAKAITPPAEEPADPDYVGDQVWVSKRLPGKTFTKKADLKQALIDLDAKELAEKSATPVTAALAEIVGELDKRAPKKDEGDDADETDDKETENEPDEAKDKKKKKKKKEDSEKVRKAYTPDERKKFAKDGVAMSDGSYPIPDKDALKDAIEAVGGAKNKLAAKRHIVRRAKALDATDMLPIDWSGSTQDGKKFEFPEELKKDGLQKNLWIVAEMVRFLANIESLEECYEQGVLFAAKAQTDLTKRFGALVVELGDVTAEILDECVSSMRAEEAGEAMALGLKIEALAKAGARHSKADQSNLNDAHDYLVAAGADCKGKEAEKGLGSEDLQKRLDAEREAFTKTLDGVTEILKDVLARVKNIEEQPAAGRPSVFRTVDKSQDMTGVQPSAESVLDQPGAMEALAEAAIRKSHQRPVRAVPGLSHSK